MNENISLGRAFEEDPLDITMEPIDPKTGLNVSSSPEGSFDLFNFSDNTGRVETNIGIKPFKRILEGEVYTGVGEEELKRRAWVNQSGAEQFGAFLNQAVVGEIVGGTIEGIGYLTDLQQYNNLIAGKEEEFGNWFSDIGKSLRTWSEETTPIYTDPEAKAFNPGSWSWWMSNGKSVASTLPLMIPAMGTIRLLGMAGKAMDMGKSMAMFGKTLGMLPGQLEWAATGVSSAVVSRHMENVMEASQIKDSVLEEMLSLGVDNKEAEEYSSKAAANAYKKNWLMLLQDIPEYLILGNFMSKASKPLTANIAKQLNLPVAPVIAKKGFDAAFDIVTEGLEEGGQFVIGEESRRLAKVLADPEYAKANDFGDRFKDYIKDGELWTNMTMGALGAGVSILAAKGLKTLGDKKELTPEEQREKVLNDYGTLFSQANVHLTKASELGYKDSIDRATTDIISRIGQKAVTVGGLQDAITFISNIKEDSSNPYTAQQLLEHNMTEADAAFVKDNFGTYEKDLTRFGEIYEKYIQSKDKRINPVFAARLAQSEFTLEKLKDKETEIKSRLSEAYSSIEGSADMSTSAESLINTFSNLRGFDSLISFYSSRVGDPKKYNLSEEEVNNYKKQLDYYNEASDTIRKEYIESLKEYKSKDNKERIQDESKGFNLANLLADSIKDNKDNPASPLFNLIKAYKSNKFFGEELKAARENYEEDVRAYKNDIFDSDYNTNKAIDLVNKTYGDSIKDILDRVLKTQLLSDDIKNKIKEALDVGTNPLSLFVRSLSKDLPLTDNILNSLKSKRDLLDELNTTVYQYFKDLFYSIRRERASNITDKEDLTFTRHAVIDILNKEVNKNLPKTEEEVDTADLAEGTTVDKITPTDGQVQGAVNALNNTTNQEDIVDNTLYTDVDLLNTSIREVMPTGINYIRVSYKGEKGIIEKLQSGKKFVFISDKVKDKASYIFTESDLTKTLKALGIYPIKHNLFNISFESNNVTIGTKSFVLPISNPTSAIIVDDETKEEPIPVAIKLNSKTGNKVYEYNNPILVQELAYAIENIDYIRFKLYDSFREKGIEHPLIVKDPDNDRSYYVYNRGSIWEVVDNNGSIVTTKTVIDRVLDRLFRTLDNLSDINKEERDEYRKNVKGVLKPTPEEINSVASTSALSPSKEDKKRQRRLDDESREESNRSQDQRLYEVGKDLATNEASNTQSNTIDTNPPSETPSDGNVPQEEPGDTGIDDIIYNDSTLVNLRNLALTAKELNKYLENPNNTTDQDSLEFVIDFDGNDNNEIGLDVKKFWKNNPDLKERINKKDFSIINIKDENDSFNTLVDNIPIKTVYKTKTGETFDGYYLPSSGYTKMISNPVGISTKEEVFNYYTKEKKRIRNHRSFIIKNILKGDKVISDSLCKNSGEPNNITGTKLNVAEALQQEPSEIILGYSMENHIIDWSDKRVPIKESSTAGNVFTVTKDTCNKAERELKLNPTKISKEHANIILNAYEIAIKQKDYKAGYPINKGDNVKSISDKTVRPLSVKNVIDTLVHNGDNANVSKSKLPKPYLVAKQLFEERGNLYYGDFNKGGDKGGIINLNNITKEQRDAFVKYVSSNLNYSIPAYMFNKTYKIKRVIGSLVIDTTDTGITYPIKNNLLTTDVARATNGTLFRNPWLGFRSNSLKVIKKEVVNIKERKQVVENIVEQVDNISGVTTIKINKVEDFSKLGKNSVINIVDFGKESIFGIVKEDDKGLYIDVQITSFDEIYPNKIYLTDTNNLRNAIRENIYPGSDSSYFTSYVNDNSSSISDVEGKKSIEEELDDLNPFAREINSSIKPKTYDLNKEINRVKRWLSGTFESPNIKLTDKLIHVLSHGRQAWGTWQADAITIYKGAAEGTTYHEAFHHVSLLYLTPKERFLIYKEAINRYNLDKNSTPRQIEEVLAEKFREYVLTLKKAEDEPRTIGAFFRDLVQFIVTFVTGRNKIPNLTIDNLFKSIETGKFKHARPLRTNLIKYTGEQYLSEYGFTPTQVDSIVNTMLFQLFKRNNITYSEQIPNMKLGVVLEFLQERKERYIALQNKVRAAGRKDKIAQEIDNKVSVFTEIVKNQSFFYEVLKSKLLSMGIIPKTNYTDNGVELIKETIGEEELSTQIEHYNKSVYEFNSADNVLANIKMFLVTIPVTGEIEPLTGLPVYSDFNSIYSKVMYDLWKFDDVYDMIKYMQEQTSSDPFYDVLINGLVDKKTGEVYRVGLIDAPERIRTQFHKAFNRFRHNFTSLLVNNPNNPTYKIVEAASEKESRNILTGWGRGFQYSKVFKNNSNVVDRDFASTVLKYYRDLIKTPLLSVYDREGHSIPNVSTYITRVVKLFNSIGVNISESTFVAYLQDMVNNNSSLLNIDDALIFTIRGTKSGTGFHNYLQDIFEYNPNSNRPSLFTIIFSGGKITNNKGETVTFPNSLKAKGIIKELSLVYSKVNIEKISNVVFGPDNNMYYQYSPNSYTTAFVKKINKENSVILDELLNDIYCKHSVYLDQIRNGAKLELLTYSSFNNKKFVDLDPSEDFIFKFRMLMDNIIPFPTLADKTTYHMFKGLERISFEGASFDTSGNFIFPEEVYNTILGYINDETARIKKAKQDINKAEETKDYSYLRKNYHYKEVNSKTGIPILRDDKGHYTGNATKYMHFPVLNNQKINKKQVLDFLKQRVLDTIEYANKHGIITITYGSSNKVILNIQNNKLDTGLVNSAINKYGNEKQAIIALLSDYTINTIVANIESEKLLSGDIAFYKNSTDKAKRLSELIAPGDDLRINFNSGELAGITTYNSVTIKTSLQTSKLSDPKSIIANKFREDIINKDPSLGLPQNVGILEDTVKAILSSYSDFDSSDGTVWITPHFHRELLIRMGEWTDLMEDAFNLLLQEDSNLSLEDDIKLRKILMQPLKYVYYGSINEDDVRFPVYDKMSFATLFPRQVKGTKLEPLYKWMVSNKIANAKFDSAVKVGDTKPLMYFNSDGSINTESFNDAVIKPQRLENLRLQQSTAPHIVNRGLLATQVKKIIDEELVEMSKSLISLSNKGVKRAQEALGIDKYDNIDNSILFDKYFKSNAVMSKLPNDIIDSIKTGPDGNPYMYLDTFVDNKWFESRLISTIKKYTTDTKVPGNAYFQATSFGLESLAVDDKLQLIDAAGFCEVKVSINLFKEVIPNYNKLTFEEARKWVLDNRDALQGIVYRIPTQGINMVNAFVVKDVLPEYTANTILVPYEFVALTESDFDIDKLYIYTFNYYTDKDGEADILPFFEGDSDGNINDDDTLKKIYKQEYGKYVKELDKLESIMNAAKYRTSFHTMLTKELSDEELRDLKSNLEDQLSIILENQGIDYITPSMIQDRIEYLQKIILSEDQFILANRGKSSYEVNSKKAVENKLLDTYIKYLTSDSKYAKTKSPLAYYVKKTKKLANHIHELEGGDKKELFLESVSPVFQHETKTVYTTSKSGVGPFALNIVHHVLGTVAKLGLKEYIGIGNKTESGGTDLSKTVGIDKESIFNWISAMISANVDAPKDPYIFYLNVNPTTWNITNLLLRAGVGENTFYFLAQPIIKDLINSNNDYFAIKEKYDNLLSSSKGTSSVDNNVLISKYNKDIFSKEQLEKNIDIKTIRKAEWYARQLAILDKYIKINKQATTLSKVVRFSQVDTGGHGNNLAQIKLFSDGLEELLADDSIINMDKLFTDTFLETYKKNSIDLIHRVFGKTTIGSSTAFIEMLKKITKELGVYSVTSRYSLSVVNSVIKELLFIVKSRYFNSARGYNMDSNKLKDLFIGDNSVGSIIYNIKTGQDKDKYPGLENNFLINYLNPFREDANNIWFLESPVIDSNDPKMRERLINGFEEILKSENNNINMLGKRMFAYAFFTSGFTRNIYSFNHAIPHKYLKDVPTGLGNDGFSVDYNTFIGETLSMFNDRKFSEELYAKVRNEFYLNNWEDNRIVPVIDHNKMSDNHPIKTVNKDKNGNIVDSGVSIFTMDNNELVIGLNRKGQFLFKPYIKLIEDNNKANLYEYVGYVYKIVSDNKREPFPVYKHVDKRGFTSENKSHRIKEYGFEGNSIIDANNTSFEVKDVLHVLSLMNGDKMRYPFYESFVYISDEDQEVIQYNSDIIKEYEEKVIKTEEQLAQELGVGVETTNTESKVINNPVEYTNHSGGALGSDSEWDKIGNEYGVVNHNHYYYGTKTPIGNIEISKEDLEEGWQHVLKANKTLMRSNVEQYKNLLSRNWLQVKNADAIFAIGTFTNDMKVGVAGGTGWAVQMAQDIYKPVYFYDQIGKKWYKSDTGNFYEVDTPILTKNFAGIGTRSINEAGKQAIRDVYEKTFKQQSISLIDNISNITDEEANNRKKECE